MTPEEREAKWAARDRRREETEAYYAAQADAERDRLAAIIGAALAASDWDGTAWDEAGAIAVDALTAAGVIFAYRGGTVDCTL